MEENKNYQEPQQETEGKGKVFFKVVGTIILALVLAVVTVIAINLGGTPLK